MSPEVEGYAGGWSREEPEHPKSESYMRGWKQTRADRAFVDARKVGPSKAKTKPKPTDDQRISFVRRPGSPPPGARARAPEGARP
jgi:hypothetical protein